MVSLRQNAAKQRDNAFVVLVTLEEALALVMPRYCWENELLALLEKKKVMPRHWEDQKYYSKASNAMLATAA